MVLTIFAAIAAAILIEAIKFAYHDIKQYGKE